MKHLKKELQSTIIWEENINLQQIYLREAKIFKYPKMRQKKYYRNKIFFLTGKSC